METLNAGMYVRTRFGISKIIEDGNVKVIKSDNEETYDVDKNGRHYPTQFGDYIWTSDVIKASHNIIELIEEKDVIKFEYDGTEYICDVYEYSGRKDDLVVCCETNVIHIKEVNDRFELKSIVTKEQFESMSYSLEG